MVCKCLVSSASWSFDSANHEASHEAIVQQVKEQHWLLYSAPVIKLVKSESKLVKLFCKLTIKWWHELLSYIFSCRKQKKNDFYVAACDLLLFFCKEYQDHEISCESLTKNSIKVTYIYKKVQHFSIFIGHSLSEICFRKKVYLGGCWRRLPNLQKLLPLMR